MNGDAELDLRFRRAVEAMDAGDVATLERILAGDPALLRERLREPGEWLRAQVDGALEGYFAAPRLLWFVAENPIRTGRLPANIAEVARTIVRASERAEVADLAKTANYALGLVVTGRVPRESGVQVALMDVLLDAGARPDHLDGAVMERASEAAEHLLRRGARPTLATALFLGRRDEAAHLLPLADDAARQTALVGAALRGDAEAVRWLLDAGVPATARSATIHPHATALHHAVWAGSLEAVRLLAEAGADRTARDRIHNGTPLGWAEYVGRDDITAYLRGLDGEQRAG
jgi:peptide-methionine (S)-S-oxide reductase